MTDWEWLLVMIVLLFVAVVLYEVNGAEQSIDNSIASAFSGPGIFTGALQNIGSAFSDLADTWSPLTS